MAVYCVRAQVGGKWCLATHAGWVPVCAALLSPALVQWPRKAQAVAWAKARMATARNPVQWQAVPVAYIPRLATLVGVG